MSQPSVSSCVSSVCEIICVHMLNKWIKFPINRATITTNKNLFEQKFRFPDVFASPSQHPAEVYYNRKGYHSINVQIIGDASLKIQNINARYPGSVHDAAIWMMLTINRHLQTEYINDRLNGHLVGDEGYPLSPWLMVQYPGNHGDNTPEGRFIFASKDEY